MIQKKKNQNNKKQRIQKDLPDNKGKKWGPLSIVNVKFVFSSRNKTHRLECLLNTLR